MFKLFRKPAPSVSTDDVINLVERAYNQAWWDAKHSNDPRIKARTKAQGLANFLEREANNLR